MNRLYFIPLSLLFGLFLYALPASGGIAGCCQTTSRACELTGGGCPGGTLSFHEGGWCEGGQQCRQNPDHVVCYQVKDTLKIPTGKGTEETTFFVSVPQFGSDVRCKLKGRTREFCAPACKHRPGEPDVGGDLCKPDPSETLGFDRVCYNIENCTSISGQIDDLEAIVTDQWDDININGEGTTAIHKLQPTSALYTGGKAGMHRRR